MKKIWTHTWIYKTYNMFRKYSEYRKVKKYVSPIIYTPEFKLILNKYLNIDIRKDWLGRLYGIINPSINREGFFDISNTIIEIDGDNTNSNNYVQYWVYNQLNMINNLFNFNNLYDYLTVDIQKVGPINTDNYLVILDIASRQEFASSFKRWLKMSIFYIIIALLISLAILSFINI